MATEPVVDGENVIWEILYAMLLSIINRIERYLFFLKQTPKRSFHEIFQMSDPEEKICSITMMGAGGIRSSLQKGDVSFKKIRIEYFKKFNSIYF